MNSLNLTRGLVIAGLGAGLSLNGFGQPIGKAPILDELKARQNNQVVFTENKGQVTDQNKALRNDVLFGGENRGLVFHLRSNGISYQLNRIDAWKTEKPGALTRQQNNNKQIEKSTVYRVDINWLHANRKAAVLRHKELPGHEIHYIADKMVTARSYGEVVYANLYKGIDLKWYEKDGELKYDYLCAAGSDYKNILLQIEGAGHLNLNAKGELEITTPLGTIVERSPLVVQGGKKLESRWVLENNVLGFEIENLNKELPYVIDPAVRTWGTYYGGNSFDYANACASYTNGDVYMAGSTYLNTSTIIATTGSHQSTLGGWDDAFLVKFNSSGVRQWATYYGGSDSDNGRSCAVDASGNVYMCGITSSTNGIATAAAHQPVIGGGNMPDGFLVKFNSSGIRQWATYYGGNSIDEAHQCALDPSGNIYMSGTTDLATGTVIATATGYQTSAGGLKDGFLVKFNASGVRQWGTYYGGSNIDFGSSCAADANNVYLAGTTTSTNSAMASPGCHQSAFGGSLYDGYLVKFNNSTGARLWATFYGGNAIDQAYGCGADAAGNVYMCGASSTSVANVIATAASHQSAGATAGDDDAFLVQFNSLGVRQWATYYGGNDYEAAFGCAIDGNNNVYLVGTTGSTLSTAIATPGSHQTTLGTNTGGTNAFLAKFNSSGVRQWGTYYGVDGEDGNGCALGAGGDIYMCGPTTATNSSSISTPLSHQPNQGGIVDAYLVKFQDCNAQGPMNATPASNQLVCTGNSATLSATAGTATINWYATASSTAVIGTGTNYATPILTAGNFTFYAEAPGCGGNFARIGITVTVSPTPTITAAPAATICPGQSFTVQPNGASTYTVFEFFSGTPLPGMVVSPLTTTVYALAGTNASGCVSALSGIQIFTVTVAAAPTISVPNGTICPGQSFVIQPSGAASYTIQGGTATVSPASAASYTIAGTGINGCLAANAATCSITIQAIPTVAVNSGSVCSQSVYTIQPSGASTYTIQGGSNTVTPSANTSYTVIGATSAGCLSQNVATCNIAVLPTPTVSASGGTICLGRSFTINPSGATTYSILDNNTGNPYTSNMVVSPLTTTNYAIAGTGSNGCISSLWGLALINVTVNVATISVNSGTLCSGGNFTIVPAGGVTYTFQGGSNIVNPSTTTNYTVAGTDSQGCIGTATASVTVAAPPTLSVNSGAICQGSSFSISPVGFSTYTISGGKAIVSPSTTTNYTISGTSAGLCPVTKTLVSKVSVTNTPRMPFPSTITAPATLKADAYFPLNNLRVAVEPLTDLVYVDRDTHDQLQLNVLNITTAATYTLKITPAFGPGFGYCPATYTFFVNPPEDLTKYWVFPDFVSANGDDKNDSWSPEYKGTYVKPTPGRTAGITVEGNLDTYFEGLDLIDSYKVGRFDEKGTFVKLVEVIYDRSQLVYSFNGGQGFMWNPSGLFKVPTACIWAVKFKNGTTKTGFITVDPSTTK